MHPLGFCILFTNYSQIRTQNRIQEIVPNLRFLLLFRGIFTLLSANFKVYDKKSLSSEVFVLSVDEFFWLLLKLWVFVKIVGIR